MSSNDSTWKVETKPYSIGDFVRELRGAFADRMQEHGWDYGIVNEALLDFDHAVDEISKDLLDHLMIQGER